MKILTNKKYNDILEKCKILDNNVFDLKQCLHRKETEHIEELVSKNQCIIKLKIQLEEYDRKLFITKNELDMRQKSIDNKLNQQKEFINYMMNTIENITHDETDDEEIKGYLIQRGNTFKEILSKYKEIIGGGINE